MSLSPIHKPASSSPKMASHQNMQMPFELCILVCRSHDRLMMHYVQLLLQTQSITQPQSTNILRPASHQNTLQSTCIDNILDRLIFHTCMLNAVISPLLNSKRDPLKINLLLDLPVFWLGRWSGINSEWPARMDGSVESRQISFQCD